MDLDRFLGLPHLLHVYGKQETNLEECLLLMSSDNSGCQRLGLDGQGSGRLAGQFGLITIFGPLEPGSDGPRSELGHFLWLHGWLGEGVGPPYLGPKVGTRSPLSTGILPGRIVPSSVGNEGF